MISTVMFLFIQNLGDYLDFIISVDLIVNGTCIVCSMKFGTPLFDKLFCACKKCVNMAISFPFFCFKRGARCAIASFRALQRLSLPA